VEVGEFLLEGLEHRTEHILAAFQHFGHLGVDFGLEVVILPDVAVERHAQLGLKHRVSFASSPGLT
jgi:hypothetical protein